MAFLFPLYQNPVIKETQSLNQRVAQFGVHKNHKKQKDLAHFQHLEDKSRKAIQKATRDLKEAKTNETVGKEGIAREPTPPPPLQT